MVRLLKCSVKELEKSSWAGNCSQCINLQGRWEVKPTLFPDTPLVMHSEQSNPSLKDVPTEASFLHHTVWREPKI